MRRPPVGRLIAGVFAATVVSLICIDTSMACRFLFRNRCANPCVQVTTCSPAPVACAPVCNPAPKCCPPVDCCYDGATVVGPEMSAPIIEGGHTYDSGIPIEAAPTPMTSEGTIIHDSPSVDDGTVITDDGVASEVPDSSSDELGEPEPEIPAAEPDETTDDGEAEDVFDDLPSDDAADDALDGLGDMPEDELDLDDIPEDTPDDDVFGAPADDDDALPDFGDPPAADDELPGFDDVPADGDLPTETPEDADDSLDDLFGRHDHSNRAIDLDTIDDVFGYRELQTEPAGTQDDLVDRVWTDNTGRYRTVGRLVNISSSHIRLLKDNGRFSTVPKVRLSQADVTYVERMASALGVREFDQLARR